MMTKIIVMSRLRKEREGREASRKSPREDLEWCSWTENRNRWLDAEPKGKRGHGAWLPSFKVKVGAGHSLEVPRLRLWWGEAVELESA